MSRLMRLVVQDDDEVGFVREVAAFVSGITRLHRPAEFFLVKTNTWFGPNWLRFRGKVLGLLGVWAGEKSRSLSLPPFVPHRILWERRYVAPAYKQAPIRKVLHLKMPADQARTRYVHDVAPGASLLWYSGASKLNKRGAIMAYVCVGDSYWTWYVGLALNSEWKVVKVAGATDDEIAEIRRPGGLSIPIQEG
jgi:hypothetical protein